MGARDGFRRNVRRCALQALYQFDAGLADALDAVRASLADSPGGAAAQQAGFELALNAWAFRATADETVRPLAEDWPTHRQPVIDRNILRLACYEMMQTDTPPKVAINEAVELAKEFSTEKSYLFINGVLDKILRNSRQETGDRNQQTADGSKEPGGAAEEG